MQLNTSANALIIGAVSVISLVGHHYSTTAQASNIAPKNTSAFQNRNSSGHVATINDLRGLMRSLRAPGLTVKRGGRISQPFFSVRGSILTVNGEEVQVFEYANARVAEKDAKKVSARGNDVGMSMPMWIAPPHFYKSGRLIVLYLGESPSVIKGLEGALGPQFAGK